MTHFSKLNVNLFDSSSSFFSSIKSVTINEDKLTNIISIYVVKPKIIHFNHLDLENINKAAFKQTRHIPTETSCAILLIK